MVILFAIVIIALVVTIFVIYKVRPDLIRNIFASPATSENDPVAHYTGLGLVFGMSFGLVFGTASDDVGKGLVIGMDIGMDIGASIGMSVKKKKDTDDINK